jgi:aryl-alcohol dehydrogenase-like predicted oxidoreductase
MGAMRLSTESSRDDERSVAVLHAAFEGGITLIDTADAYARDAGDVGHNERLVARALATWRGDARRVQVITKGGMTRPEGRWVPDGRASHLKAACHASRAALGVPRIALYQLHAPDPRVAWTTSVRALAALVREGVIDSAGLCNVTVQQIEAARSVVPIATVQAELSPWKDRLVASGVVGYCLAHDITLLAYRPFGGVAGARRVAKDGLVCEISAAHGASPFAIVLAWMRGLAPHIIPLPGPTREESARDCARAQTLTLEDAEQTALDLHFPVGRIRTPARRPAPQIATAPAANGDIVMVMGLPGAGKTTLASSLVADGYERLNRDETGGSLAGLVPRLETLFDRRVPRIVLDNTYLSRAARAAVIDAAARHGRSIRGVWLDASVEDAQVNVVWRMLHAHGRLLTSEELKRASGPDNLSPSAMFRAQRQVEPPDISEGFTRLEKIPFVRRCEPSLHRRAIVLWCDGVLRASRSADAPEHLRVDESIFATRRARLARYHAEGWRLFAMSWEPQVAGREMSAMEVDAEFARLRERLGFDIEFHYCPHGAGPPICWCRKPLPGLGVLIAHRHGIDPRQSIYVGITPQDRLFAQRMDFQYRNTAEFFDEPSST